MWMSPCSRLTVVGTWRRRDTDRRIYISGSSDQNFGVSRTVEEGRHPSDLEIESDRHEDVGVRELQDVARFWIDEVWILVAHCDGKCLDAIAADLTGDVFEIWKRGYGLEVSLEMKRLKLLSSQ